MTTDLLERATGAPIIVDDITRREFLTALVAVGLLSGCGRGRRDGAATQTRLVQDFFGTVEIPADPQRIVAADDTALGNLLDLGVRPVATAVNLLSVPEFLGGRLEGIEDISSPDEPRVNLERLAALEPDLIFTLGVEWNKDRYDLLSQVGPTFGYRYGYASSEQIRTNMTELGRALDREADAEAQVARLDDRVADMRARIADAGLHDKPVTVLRVGGGGFFSIRHGSTESVLMEELGITRPPNQRSIEDFATDLSQERLEDVDGYALYLYVDTDGQAEYEQLQANPLWATLDVVRNNRVFLVDSGVWNGISLPAAHAILDDIERTLLA